MRQVVQLHTIEQWFGQSQDVRSMVLQNIKLKARLESWMKAKFMSHQANPPMTRVKTTCRKCEGAGHYDVRPRLPGIHPSQIGHPCLLKIYNQMIGKPGVGKFDFRGQLIFDLGSQIHHMFQTYGLNGAWGPGYIAEAEISEEYQHIAWELLLEGSADADHIMVIDDIPGMPIFEVGIIHEYKSIKDENFKKLTGPKPEHKQQAMLYAVALNRPVVVYMYFNKNDSNLVEYPVAFDPYLWKIILDKATRLNEYYDKEVPPPGNPDKYRCKQCEFSHSCPDYLSVKGKL